MTLACGSLCVLVLVGALLHLAWWLAIAALLWAPSGACAIVVGWHVTQGSESIALGGAAAIITAALVRFALLRLWALLFAPRFVTLVAWREAQ
jgi:hypothetical protein